MPNRRGLIIDAADNVASLLEEALPGDTVRFASGGAIASVDPIERIPFGYKMAVREIGSGEPIVKYGATIGRASQPIAVGSLVHVHNLGGVRGRGDLERKA